MSSAITTLTLTDVAISRGERLLFEGVSLAANAGDAVELRGPNGSGKSSLLRAIAGLLPLSAGQIFLAPQADDDDSRPVAYLGHLDAVKSGETVSEQLRFWASLGDTQGSCVDIALTKLGLDQLSHLYSGRLSAGQKRRVALARLLVKPEPIWLLDEPAAPLDDAGRDILARLIADHREKGGIVLAAVHDPLPGGASQTIILGASE